MHKIVLSGVAALALLGVLTCGRGAPVVQQRAEAAPMACHTRLATADATRATRTLLVSDNQSGIQARRLLVADKVPGGSAQMPAMAVLGAPC
jgi:hypothetical protein